MSEQAPSRKGIVLAGGKGTRLYPLTVATNKHLLPVFDKPMIYYPLANLMLAGIRRILIITSPPHLSAFQRLLGSGSELGLQIGYGVQTQPDGVAQALTIGRNFIDDEPVTLILGDNFFYGDEWLPALQRASQKTTGATIFAYQVANPGQYGVVSVDSAGKAKSLDEKPDRPQSSLAVPGVYIYDHQASQIAAELVPSARGELEITDVNLAYLRREQLYVELLSPRTSWFDLGTHASLLSASKFVEKVQSEQNRQIGCIEEIAYEMGFIDAQQFRRVAAQRPESYRRYLLRSFDEDSGGRV